MRALSKRQGKGLQGHARVEDALVKDKIVLNAVIIIEVAHYLIKNLGPLVGKEKLDTFLRAHLSEGARFRHKDQFAL